MTQPIPRAVLGKVRKLALLPGEVKQSHFAVSVTRLNVLKSLCQEPDVANRLVTPLARQTLERVEHGKRRAERLPRETAAAHRRLMKAALAEMEGWLTAPSEARRGRLRELWLDLEAEQNEYERIKWGSVR